METFLFWFCGAAMVLGGLMTVVQRSAVVSAVWLIFAFVAAAGIFALLHAPFVAILQVLVYAGAIMVLFLFVIMMLQGPVLEGERRRMKPALWPAVAIPPLAVLVLVGTRIADHGTAAFTTPLPAGFGSPTHVAELLLGRYLLAFELISIALLVAIIGALAIGKEERKLPWK
ncbi:MAG: NADH-quinone oxidoreductase subunit J [Krumholzibacteria bacterium]|nr:NADH-quinone oxidoreductase subunit J [Candidatus Krumholzibacteria bacterium]